MLAALFRRLFGVAAAGPVDTVLFNIRLPRVLAAMLVGAALGAAYQSLFRNPLVSPDILGVSTGAGLAAVVGILLGLPVAAIQFLGFGGGLATVGIVAMLARTLRGGGDVLVLAGLAVLVSTHEPEQAFAVATRVAVIGRDDHFVTGPVADVLTPEQLTRLYGVALTVERTPSGRLVVGPAR